MVDYCGAALRILPVSSGSGPNYFFDGVAIHGNPAVPQEPKSHGCIRIPMFAAKEFSELAPVGMPVVIHDGTLPLRIERP